MNVRSLFAPLVALLLVGFTSPPSNPARDDYAATQPAKVVKIDVLGNDRMPQSTAHLLAALPARNGTVRIDRGEVSYTPRKGFKGKDQFVYLVAFKGPRGALPTLRNVPDSEAKLVPWLARQPRDVLKGLGLARVKVDVDPTAKTVQLRGRVYDGPIPGAIVSADIAGNSFETQADASGNYALRLFGLGGGQFVTVHADGISPSGAVVEFASHAGTLGRLAQEAGSDGALTREENPQVQVTNLSTAAYVLTKAANGNADISSEAQLRVASQAVDVNALMALAAVTQLVVDGGVALPAGFGSVMDLISSPDAVDAFAKSLPAGQLAAAIAAVAQDQAIATAFADEDFVGQPYALVLASAPGTINVAFAGGEVLLNLNAAGSGELLQWEANAAPAATWALDDSTLVVTRTFPTTATYRTPMFTPGCEGLEYDVSNTVLSYRIERVFSQANVDSLLVTWTDDIDVTDLNPFDACVPPTPDGTVSSPAKISMLGMRYPDGWMPFASDAATRTRMITLSPTKPTNVFESPSGIYNLATGSVTETPGVDGVDNAVVGADGVMTMTLRRTDGAAVQLTLARLQHDGQKGDGLLGVLTYPDGSRAVKHMLSAAVDGSLLFSSTNLQAEWVSGFDRSQPRPAAGDPLMGEAQFKFVFQPSNIGYIQSLFDPGDGNPPQVATSPFTWTTTPQRMELLQGTPPFQVPRSWIPLAVSGDINNPASPARIYVLENRDGFRRPNFYERDP